MLKLESLELENAINHERMKDANAAISLSTGAMVQCQLSYQSYMRVCVRPFMFSRRNARLKYVNSMVIDVQ